MIDREHHKLEIISEEYKDIYFNCYLTESQKIVAGCGVIGYKCKAVCDGLGAWENQKTKSFYEQIMHTYKGTDIHFSVPYTGKMDISVDGNTSETISGIKSSTNQSTLKGVTKVTDNVGNQSNVFDIGQSLNRIDDTTYDTADLKAGIITLNTEIKRLTDDNYWEISDTYDSNVLYVRHPYSLQKIGLCNRFNYTVMDSQWRNNEEAITVYMNYMYIKINKTVASDLTAFKSWLNSTSVLYIAPLIVPNIINIAPVSSHYLSGVNTMTTDNNGNLHVTLYNNISNNVFVNTSDYNGYMIPNLTVITCGTTGGTISIENVDDVNNYQISFTGLLPNEVITIDELGQMQSSTGLNRCDNWNMKRLRLVSGNNHINITGDVVRLDINYQDVRRLGI